MTARRCPFCFPASILPAQLLATTEHFYLLAPAGQMIEGFLCIMTHGCRDAPDRLRCMDDIPGDAAEDLHALRRLVADFYRDVYRAPPVFYENGRGGGRASSFPGGDFMFHPHLCALPGPLIVHEPLLSRFQYRTVGDFPLVRHHIGRRPYLYVHTLSDPVQSQPVVYFAADRSGDAELERLSLKELLAAANPGSMQPDWRSYPGHAELARLIEDFGFWYASAYSGDGKLD